MSGKLFQNEDRIQFEVTPLDVGITKIHFQFLQDFTRSLTDSSGKDIFTYSFQSKDPTLDLSTVELNCFQDKNSGQDKLWVVEIACSDRNGRQENATVFKGTETELVQYLKTQQVFISIKKLAKSF